MASYNLDMMFLKDAMALKGDISYKSKGDLCGRLVNNTFTHKLNGWDNDRINANIEIEELDLSDYVDVLFEQYEPAPDQLIVSFNFDLEFYIDNNFAMNLDRTYLLQNLKEVEITFNNVYEIYGDNSINSKIEQIERLIVSLIRSGKIEIAFTFELI